MDEDEAQPARGRRTRVERVVEQVEGVLTGGFLVAVVLLVVTQVVTRYFLQRPPVWTEEMARYALVWLTFLGAAYLAGRRRHITVAVLDRVIGPRRLPWVVVAADLLTAAMCLVVVFSSAGFLERVSRQTTAAGGLPKSYVYGAVAVGFALVALHCLTLAARDVRALVTGHEPAPVDRTGTADGVTP